MQINLKSPVYTIAPFDVWKQTPTESGILCVVPKNDTVVVLNSTVEFESIVFKSTRPNIPASPSFSCISPTVN